MDSQKSKRVIVAFTVGAVMLLFVILLPILVYQFISIGALKAKIEEYDQATARYEQLCKTGNDTLEARSTRWWIERRARELGLTYPDDSLLD